MGLFNFHVSPFKTATTSSAPVILNWVSILIIRVISICLIPHRLAHTLHNVLMIYVGSVGWQVRQTHPYYFVKLCLEDALVLDKEYAIVGIGLQDGRQSWELVSYVMGGQRQTLTEVLDDRPGWIRVWLVVVAVSLRWVHAISVRYQFNIISYILLYWDWIGY